MKPGTPVLVRCGSRDPRQAKWEPARIIRRRAYTLRIEGFHLVRFPEGTELLIPEDGLRVKEAN